MPKGVEHIDFYGEDAQEELVKGSLMPKGVEHLNWKLKWF